MSTPPITSTQAAPKSTSSDSPVGIERRRRKRAKITAQVHMRGVNTPEPFEEICKSVDVSRDGLLVTSARAGYWKGQRLEVVFPYSTAAAALNSSQPAEVVRVVEQDGRYAVALQFINAKSDAAAKVDPSVADVHVAGNAMHAKQQSVVLAVESDPKTAEIMRNILSNDGYTVIIVPTAQQALDILRNTVPVVFLAEVEAKDMSGHDLCLIIKRNDRLQRVPVILLTKSAQPADYSASHQLGAVVCMAKPFKPERLLHVVRLVAPPPTARSAYGASRYASGTVERAI
ncbi:MAG: response regulator [Candidatus Acidiferrales bacterium]|jgi:CheY-like chemotaxis protein